MAASTHAQPASIDFSHQLVASGAIPGGASTSNNPAAGFPNSGGNAGGMFTGSVDEMLQNGGLDDATTLGSVNSIFSAISQGGVFAGDMFAVFEKYLGNLQTLKNFKSLFALGGVSLTNARLFLGSGVVPSQQGQGQAPSK